MVSQLLLPFLDMVTAIHVMVPGDVFSDHLQASDLDWSRVARLRTRTIVPVRRCREPRHRTCSALMNRAVRYLVIPVTVAGVRAGSMAQGVLYGDRMRPVIMDLRILRIRASSA